MDKAQKICYVLVGAGPPPWGSSLGPLWHWDFIHEVWIWQHCKINSHSPTMGASGRPQPPKPDSMGGRSGPIAPVDNWCTHHQPTVARRWQKSAFWPDLPCQGLKLATWLPPMAPNGECWEAGAIVLGGSKHYLS